MCRGWGLQNPNRLSLVLDTEGDQFSECVKNLMAVGSSLIRLDRLWPARFADSCKSIVDQADARTDRCWLQRDQKARGIHPIAALFEPGEDQLPFWNHFQHSTADRRFTV